jgi:hypothetical protein
MSKTTGEKKHTPRATGEEPERAMVVAIPPDELGAAAALSAGVFRELSVTSAIPHSWEDRARKAVEYYLEEPLVANAINAWRTFALGDEIQVSCDDEEVQDEARDLYWRLGLNSFVKDMILQLLIKGDAIGYFIRNQRGDDVVRVICVNPVSIRLVYDKDYLVEAIQQPQSEDGSYSEEISLALDQMLHLKWNAPEFEIRGNSMVLPAFEAIQLLRDYRRAERAIAKRWATPLRFVQVGGNFGGKLVLPDQAMLDKVRNELERMDLKSGLVVPFYIKAETYGAEGISLNTEQKVREVKEDILVALGMARSIVTGDGPNFATASVSMQKMVVQLKEIKQAARDILDWVYDEWMERRGHEEVLHYQFSDLDLTAEVDQKKLLVELYDRGLISKNTLQQKMGLSPAVEAKHQEGEEIVLDTNWSVQDIAQLVALEVLTVDEARARLKLATPADKAREKSARADVTRLYDRRTPGKGGQS